MNQASSDSYRNKGAIDAVEHAERVPTALGQEEREGPDQGIPERGRFAYAHRGVHFHRQIPVLHQHLWQVAVQKSAG